MGWRRLTPVFGVMCVASQTVGATTPRRDAAPTPAPAPPEQFEAGGGSNLPAGWEAVTSQSTGDTYYKNTATGETTWDLPTAAAAGLAPDKSVCCCPVPRSR